MYSFSGGHEGHDVNSIYFLCITIYTSLFTRGFSLVLARWVLGFVKLSVAIFISLRSDEMVVPMRASFAGTEN